VCFRQSALDVRGRMGHAVRGRVGHEVAHDSYSTSRAYRGRLPHVLPHECDMSWQMRATLQDELTARVAHEIDELTARVPT